MVAANYEVQSNRRDLWYNFFEINEGRKMSEQADIGACMPENLFTYNGKDVTMKVLENIDDRKLLVE